MNAPGVGDGRRLLGGLVVAGDAAPVDADHAPGQVGQLLERVHGEVIVGHVAAAPAPK